MTEINESDLRDQYDRAGLAPIGISFDRSIQSPVTGPRRGGEQEEAGYPNGRTPNGGHRTDHQPHGERT